MEERMRRIAFLTALLLLAPQWTPEAVAQRASSQRSVAVTIDDLPYVGGSDSLSAARRVSRAMVGPLARRGVPASGFVTGSRVMVAGQIEERLDLLREWAQAGVSLENHSFSHASYHDRPELWYRDDVVRGQLFTARVAREVGDTVRFYRHPFNHAGLTPAIRADFARFLSRRGLDVAPFTVEHADYVFNRLYREARARGDREEMRRIGRAYLEQLDRAFDFAESLSLDTFNRSIPQVFLIHANDINADYLDRMLDRLEERGYRLVSLAEAVSDRAYQTPDGYTGTAGVSWLHRWRETLGLENRLRDEPDPPRWLLEAYQRLGSAGSPAPPRTAAASGPPRE